MRDKIIQLYKTSVQMLQLIEDFSIECDMLDTQEYLNWKDDLNRISLDPDRN